jgi:hypothetical protein
MASSLRLPPPSKISETLTYFDKYDYPLTIEELVYWQSSGEIENKKNITIEKSNKYFHLQGRKEITKTRTNREKISRQKWQIAREVGEKLKMFATIQAVFVTGSLAMNNAKQEDDIDVMLITSANTLWITRFFVNLYFQSQRRLPNQSQVANKLCPNLWLDANNLTINKQNLYTAHEVMQAKVLWEKNHIHSKFLTSNFWIKEYLPNAYPDKLTIYPFNYYADLIWSLLLPINLLFFVVQYLYMKPKMSTERVAPGYAFFHPKSSS